MATYSARTKRPPKSTFSGGKLGPKAQSLGAKLGRGKSSFKPGRPGPAASGIATSRTGFKSPIKSTTASAAKPAPVGQHAAPDSIYEGRVDLADRRQSQRLGDLEGQAATIKRDFGIDDPSDPYSRINGLKNAFHSRYKAASAGLAAEGQLYTGTHERALSRTRRQEEEARAGLRREYDALLSSNESARAGVKFDTEQERAAAFEDWLQRAPDAEGPAEEEEAPQAATAQTPGAQQGYGGGYIAPSPVVELNKAPGYGSPAAAGLPATVGGGARGRSGGRKKKGRNSFGGGHTGPGATRVATKPRPKVKKKGRH